MEVRKKHRDLLAVMGQSVTGHGAGWDDGGGCSVSSLMAEHTPVRSMQQHLAVPRDLLSMDLAAFTSFA